ncbi:hypothetical protein PRZ48_001926 [Zasmidium cellare]|uniref:Uncharacterized protein n=1 Tax=Zasmidium cellare TaxID=395010 RepID=A0ABR0F3Y8_ZASCE|nr:hypothetical protein PRZ48_001926 [Zasmidium cellare]
MRSTIALALVHVVVAQNTFTISNWQGQFASGSGVLQSLKPATDTSFDFSPSDYFSLRNGVGNYHTGDITLRWRIQGQAEWNDVDTSAQRDTNPQATTGNSSSLLHSTFDNVYPDIPVSISRDWTTQDGDLVLQATVKNKNASTVELGAFGFPIEFNNIFTNRTADDTTAKCVLVDPYIGLDAGYLQVTRLTGTGPNMVITPQGNASKFEAYRFLNEDPSQPTGYQTQVFEGIYAWQTLSKAYAENEWNATDPWNVPTSITLSPGQSVSYGLRFGLAQNVYDIEDAVASKDVPVAVGVPGYVLPVDMNGKLFLNTKSAVKSIDVEPSGALAFTSTAAKNSAWKAYDVTAATGGYGRARATIQYEDGRVQTVHYYITDTAQNTASKLGEFSFSKQWYTDSSDPFHRAPSVMTWDDEVGQIVLQDPRTWIAGISDEGGAGSFTAASMKSAIMPEVSEIQKLEEMANTAVWGWLQDNVTDASTGSVKYGVKRSLFYYDPAALPDFQYDPSIQWGGSWNKNDSYSVWRAYDYVWVSVLYWSLYNAELAAPGILTIQNSTWYLEKAYQTVIASQAVYGDGTPITAYADVGLMGETVWLYILKALRAENMNSEADAVEAAMKKREQLWSTQSDPFGSEMAWDSTGQEGVYLWAKYFNDTATVTKTLNSIRGYMPTVAHWGWNGNARRYWDFLYGGKLARIERMIHHYGSGLNSLPILDDYKYNKEPSSASAIYDLRIGYGGNMGSTTNIRSDGSSANAFHSYPDTLKWDGYSGDYGPNFLGHIAGSRTYLVEHNDFGWLAFGGNLAVDGDSITVEPKDMVKRGVYVASLGLALDIDAGVIKDFKYDASAKSLVVNFDKVDGGASTATLVYEDTLSSGVKLTTGGLKQQRGGYAVQLPGSVNFSIA